MGATAERNADGTWIIKLSEPVKLVDEAGRAHEHDRITIPKLRGKHMVHCPVINPDTPVGVVVGFAMHVAEPPGVVEEMCLADLGAVAKAVLSQLGKSPPTGEASSP